jgi:hypothetical protein
MASLDFVEAKSDTYLFIHWHDDNTVYLLLYVDDIVLMTSSPDLLQCTIVALQREFAMKDLGPPHHFLAIIAEWRPQGLFISASTLLTSWSGLACPTISPAPRLYTLRRSSLRMMGPRSPTRRPIEA